MVVDTFHKCNQLPNKGFLIHGSPNDTLLDNKNEEVLSSLRLMHMESPPKPLYLDNLRCDPLIPPLLNLDAATYYAEYIRHRKDVDRFSMLKNIKNIVMEPNDKNDTWILIEDRPMKFGWVSQFHFPVVNQERIIRFSLGEKSKKKSSGTTYNFLNPNNQYLLRFFYMQTYMNAGKVDVYFCGKLIGELDALYKINPKTNKRPQSSQIEFKKIVISKNHCVIKSNDDKLSYGRIDFVRRYMANVDGETIRNDNITGNFQKFKLTGIKLCGF